MTDEEALIEEIHREFREGLADRLATIRDALQRLEGGRDGAAAEAFHHAAHSLKGTAASFGAQELVGPASALTDLGLSWVEARPVEGEALDVARAELERLEAAIARYRKRMEGA